jgi:alanine-glyoxylate transaminase/serine-glyoxylate transaminase/serine-pyruvate transaminase
MDGARHPALLIVDTISSLGSVEYRHDEWGVDVTIWCSQKGMMLPPGLGLNAISEKALAAARHARLPRSYWDWPPILAAAETGLFPYTPATNLLFGLREALAMFDEEGLPAVFARHARHAEATRRAVRGWGLDVVCQNPDDYSSTLTAVMLPDGFDADQVRRLILDRFNMSLGAGLGRLAGRVFRIGHLGDLGDLSLAGTLCGVEMGLARAGVPIAREGVRAALDYLGSAA